MDWPPIGSALSPGSGNVRQDREEDVGFEVSNIPLWIDRITYFTGKGTDDPIISYQDSLLPFQEPDPMDRRCMLFYLLRRLLNHTCGTRSQTTDLIHHYPQFTADSEFLPYVVNTFR
jgi:hypothetical protein